MPYATDNNAVQTWSVIPENFRSSQLIDEAVTVRFTAVDYNNNLNLCRITVTVPSKF